MASERQSYVLFITKNLNIAAEKGDVAAAERIFEEIREKVPKKEMRLAVNTVIKACAAAGDLKKAEEWLQRLQDMNIQPNAKGIVKVADAASKAGDLERCQFWFQECDRMGFPEEQWLPYLGITLNAAGPAEQLQLREMLQARGLQLTGRDYTRMITALAQTGDTDGAEEVLNEMQRARLSPYLPAYTSVLEAYAKLGDLPGAERAFRGWGGPGSREQSRCTLAD
ncbi:unnamed protein product [Effrenium voratum]|nr:unnamed protein product [Effrenium voratum]